MNYSADFITSVARIVRAWAFDFKPLKVRRRLFSTTVGRWQMARLRRFGLRAQQFASPCITIRRSVFYHNQRAMSSTTSASLKQYLILVPDHPNRLSTRLATKAAHVKGATPLINDGRLSYFGVTLDRHPETTSTAATHTETPRLDINGSLMVMHASSEVEVQDLLQNDAYTKQGVWDIANAKILPFKAG